MISLFGQRRRSFTVEHSKIEYIDQLNYHLIYEPTYAICRPRGNPQNPNELSFLGSAGVESVASNSLVPLSESQANREAGQSPGENLSFWA